MLPTISSAQSTTYKDIEENTYDPVTQEWGRWVYSTSNIEIKKTKAVFVIKMYEYGTDSHPITTFYCTYDEKSSTDWYVYDVDSFRTAEGIAVSGIDYKSNEVYLKTNKSLSSMANSGGGTINMWIKGNGYAFWLKQ
jgi:hypothetical protein